MKNALSYLKVTLAIALLSMMLISVAPAIADIIIITDACTGPADDCLVFRSDGSIIWTSWWDIIIIVF